MEGFIAECAHPSMLRGEPVESRVAYFVSIVRDGNWKVMTDADAGTL